MARHRADAARQEAHPLAVAVTLQPGHAGAMAKRRRMRHVVKAGHRKIDAVLRALAPPKAGTIHAVATARQAAHPTSAHRAVVRKRLVGAATRVVDQVMAATRRAALAARADAVVTAAAVATEQPAAKAAIRAAGKAAAMVVKGTAHRVRAGVIVANQRKVAAVMKARAAADLTVARHAPLAPVVTAVAATAADQATAQTAQPRQADAAVGTIATALPASPAAFLVAARAVVHAVAVLGAHAVAPVAVQAVRRRAHVDVSASVVSQSAGTSPQLRMLRPRLAQRVDRGPHLHVRVHVLRGLRDREARQYLPQLRRRTGGSATTSREQNQQISGIN